MVCRIMFLLRVLPSPPASAPLDFPHPHATMAVAAVPTVAAAV